MTLDCYDGRYGFIANTDIEKTLRTMLSGNYYRLALLTVEENPLDDRLKMKHVSMRTIGFKVCTSRIRKL